TAERDEQVDVVGAELRRAGEQVEQFLLRTDLDVLRLELSAQYVDGLREAIAVRRTDHADAAECSGDVGHQAVERTMSTGSVAAIVRTRSQMLSMSSPHSCSCSARDAC